MYICLHCGHRFTNPTNRYNRIVNRWEDGAECPNCGSEDFEDAEACSECGTEHLEENLNHGLCEDCIKKAATPDNAIAYGKARQIGVEINGFLGWVYAADEIEKILLQHFISESDTWQSRMVNEYCNDDVYDFGEWLTEEKK